MQLLVSASPWRQLFSPSKTAHADPVWTSALQAHLEQQPQSLDQHSSRAWQVQLVRLLQRLDLPAWRISQLISDHNAFLYRQAIESALNSLRSHGWGEPPVNFCVLVLGSGARSESLLRPDQDNALILEDYPLERHQEIDTWFQHLGEVFTDRLDAWGIPLCKGQVMARWPLWRKPLREWQEQARIWMAGRIVKRVQLSNILLDFTPVYGEESLARAFEKAWLEPLPKAQGFLHEMGELLNEIPVALDAFDRLASDGQEAPHSHALNLKRQGLLPLQSALRLRCLLLGKLQPTSSRERLLTLLAEGVLTPQQAEDLTSALEALQSILLTAQLAAWDAGRQPDNWIDLQAISPRTEQLLRLDLKLIRDLVRQTRKCLPSL